MLMGRFLSGDVLRFIYMSYMSQMSYMNFRPSRNRPASENMQGAKQVNAPQHEPLYLTIRAELMI